MLNLLVDRVDFPDDVLVIGGEATDGAEVLDRQLGLTGLDEPSWRFGLEPHKNDEERTGNELYGERNVPLAVRIVILMDGNSVVDPETDDESQLK